MPYEPGSTECRVLIECKAQIETMLLSMAKIENTHHIRDQLVSVHNQLEDLHEMHRRHPEFKSETSVQKDLRDEVNNKSTARGKI